MLEVRVRGRQLRIPAACPPQTARKPKETFHRTV